MTLHKSAGVAGKRAAQLSLMDVVTDVLEVLGHLGEDARLVGQSAAAVAPVAHDAHLHEATASPTQQRTTVIPLKHETRIRTHTHTSLKQLC